MLPVKLSILDQERLRPGRIVGVGQDARVISERLIVDHGRQLRAVTEAEDNTDNGVDGDRLVECPEPLTRRTAACAPRW